MERIAVALIQGADGAGKSTLVNAQLARRGSRRMARVAVRSPVEISVEIGRLAAASPIDHVIVEVGNGRGHSVATGRRALHAKHAETCSLMLEYTCKASVVDSSCFLRDLVSEVHVELGGTVHVESHAMVLSEQVETSEVIVVTKTDLVSHTHLSVLLAVLSELNPTARVVIAQHGDAPSLDLFDRSSIELARALHEASPKDVLDQAAHDRALAGISSYVYRARRPFHPGRLYARVHEPWPGVLRSRGFFWLATRRNEAGVWSQAGSLRETSRGGFWGAGLDPDGSLPTPSDELAAAGTAGKAWGHGRQEITLIGLEMDTRALKDAFDACLLSPDELAAGPEAWRELSDPFPAWTASISGQARESQLRPLLE